jgi:hypothetical protein
MAVEIYNNSKRIKVINIKYQKDAWTWATKHGAAMITENTSFEGVLGYNRITTELRLKSYDSWGHPIESSYYVLERFDGYKAVFPERNMGWLIWKAANHKIGIIANADKNIDIGNHASENGIFISDEHEVSKREYTPNVNGIMQYIVKYNRGDLREAALDMSAGMDGSNKKLTIAEFESLVPKLKMAGFPCMLVDLNTIATLKPNSHDIILYTRQKGFIY